MRKLQAILLDLFRSAGCRRGRGQGRERPVHRRQSGMAVGELLVLTVPLCVVCMAVASKLAATSSVRVQGQWRTSLIAQQATTEPCGIGDTDWEMTAPIGVALADAKVRKALIPIAVSLLPKPEPLAFVSKKKVERSVGVGDYFYKATADRAVPDGVVQVTTSSTFVCNEPQHGDNRRDLIGYKGLLMALGTWQAGTLFGTFGSGGETDPSSSLPSVPELCPKGGDGTKNSPCDILSTGSGQ